MERQRALDADVIIAGAGIGGLSAAIGLMGVGRSVIVLERAPQLCEVGAGITLWSNALRALRALGAEEAVIASGSELEHGELRTPDGRVLARTPLAPVSRRIGSPCIALRRTDLVDALRGELPGGTVRIGMQVVAFEDDGDAVRVESADGTRLTCSVLVGADGLGSRVRAILHGDGPPRYAGYTCWRAITTGARLTSAGLDTTGLESRSAFETWGPGRRFGALRVSGDQICWFATQNTVRGGTDVDARAHLLGAFRGWHAPIEALIEATSNDAILRNDIFDRDPLPASRSLGLGRVTLLGDAAHPSTPNLGQGACMAIEDALVLARAMSGPPNTLPAALRSYERARNARTTLVTMRSRHLGDIGQIGSPALCRVRNVVMRALPQAWTRRAYESIATSGPG